MAIKHWKPILLKRGRNRKARPKTFKTKELADAWAKDNGITNYTLVDLKPAAKTHKFRIELKE